jgi:L-xylulokinase
MFADILECTIEIGDVDEMGTLGVSMAAGVGAGLFKDYDEAIASCVRISKVFNPIPENTAAYMKRYANWQATVDGMIKIWDEGKHL